MATGRDNIKEIAMRNFGKTLALGAAALSFTMGATAMAATPAAVSGTKTMKTSKHVAHVAKKAPKKAVKKGV
jgi:hypothetical protein